MGESEEYGSMPGMLTQATGAQNTADMLNT